MMKTDSDKPKTVAEAKSAATLAAPSCSACVQVLRHGDSEPQWASKLVWWMAGLTSQNRVYLEPRVGDIVVETTHRLGMERHGLGLIDAVGELLKIEDSKETGKIYTIRTLEGKEQRWSNAIMAVVDRPNAEVSEGGTRDSRIETAAQSRPSLH